MQPTPPSPRRRVPRISSRPTARTRRASPPAPGQRARRELPCPRRRPSALEALLRRLTDRIEFLTRGGPIPDSDPRLPPADSGILGPVVKPDALTITVALGTSLFDDRPWLSAAKPRVLQRMTQFPNDALVADLCHGDLVLQFCAHTQDTVIHALRDILKTIPDQLVLKWAQHGNVPVIPAQPGSPPERPQPPRLPRRLCQP